MPSLLCVDIYRVIGLTRVVSSFKVPISKKNCIILHLTKNLPKIELNPVDTGGSSYRVE